MKTQEAPNLLDNAKQKIKRLEDSLEQAEARAMRLREALTKLQRLNIPIHHKDMIDKALKGEGDG